MPSEQEIHEIHEASDDDDLDDVSTTSTQLSERQETYEVESILAEDVFEEEGKDEQTGEVVVNDVKRYLIKWAGYDVHDSTWEKLNQLVEGVSETLDAWQTQSMRVKRGFKEPFNLEKWEAECDMINEKKYMRQKRRREKRRRMGLPLGRDPDGDEHYRAFIPDAEENSSDDEVPTIPGSKRPIFVEANGDASEEEEDAPLVRKRRRFTEPKNDSGLAEQSAIDKGNKRSHVISSETQITRSGSGSGQGGSLNAASSSTNRTSSARSNQRTEPGTVTPAARDTPCQVQARARQNVVRGTSWTDILKGGSGRPAHSAPSDLVIKGHRSSWIGSSGASAPQRSGRTFDVPQGPVAVGPASRVGKKPGSGSRRSVAGPSIFADWDAQKQEKPRRKSSATPRPIPTLQLLNVVQKAYRNDRAPDMANLPLQNLSTGETTVLPVDKPSLPNIRRNSNDGISPNERLQMDEAATLRNKAQPISPLSPLATNETKSSPRTQPPELRGLITCYYWANTPSCHRGNSCKFEHRRTHKVAGASNFLEKEDATCWFWWNGRCNKSADKCRFSHCKTRYLAPQDARGPPSLLGIHEEPRSVTHRSSEAPSKHPFLGCWFFHLSDTGCAKSAEECHFVHRPCKWIAAKGARDPILNLNYNEDQRNPLEHPPATDGKAREIVTLASRAALNQSDSPSPPPRSPRDKDARSLPVPDASFTKHSMPSRPASLNRGKPAESDMQVTLNLHIQNQPGAPGTAIVNAGLNGFSKESRSRFLKELEYHGVPEISHMCSAVDAKSFFPVEKYQKYVEGSILATNASEAMFRKFEESLIAYNAAAVMFHPQFTMFIYQTGQAEFKDLFKPTCKPNGDSRLSFYICAQFESLNMQASTGPPNSEEEVLESPMAEHNPTSEVDGLDDRRIFQWHSGCLEKHVFLISHPKCDEEMRETISYLQRAGAKVYSSTVKGSWDFFSGRIKSGALIFHSAFTAFDRLDNLAERILPCPFNLFRLGIKPSIDKGSSPTRSLDRIFSHGHAVYIMDDCFAHQPHDTLPAIRLLANRVRKANSPTLILGRPGLMDWLEQLSREEQEREVANPSREGQADTPLKDLYVYLCHLMLDTTPRDSIHSAFSRCWPVLSLPPSHLPYYADLWRTNESKACDTMASWFAGWALGNVDQYRVFSILSMTGSHLREGWKKKYKHLTVMPPSKFVERHDRRVPASGAGSERRGSGK